MNYIKINKWPNPLHFVIIILLLVVLGAILADNRRSQASAYRINQIFVASIAAEAFLMILLPFVNSVDGVGRNWPAALGAFMFASGRVRISWCASFFKLGLSCSLASARMAVIGYFGTVQAWYALSGVREASALRNQALTFVAFKAAFMEVFALVNVIFNTISDWFITYKALWRLILVAALALKWAVGLGEEALASKRYVAKVADKTFIMVILLIVQGHLFAPVKRRTTLFTIHV